MKNFLILTKLNFKQYFALPTDPKARRKKIFAAVALALCCLPLIIMICFGIYNISGYAIKLGKAEYLLASVMFMAQIMVLFFGAVAFMGIMFYSKDNEFLNTLPVSSMTVYLSKLFMVYLSHILTTIIILVPTLVTMAIVAGKTGAPFGAEFYIFGILGIFLTPILPLLIITIIAMPLAYIGRFFKRSQTLSTIMSILIFVGVFGGYMAGMSSIGSAVNGMVENLDQMMAVMMNTFETISKIMYPNIFLTKALVGNAIFANIAIYLAIVIAAGAISIGLSGWMYKYNSTKFTEIAFRSRKKVKALNGHSQIRALMLKDIKSCMRDTSLAMNCILGLIMAPLMVGMFGLLPMFSGGTGDSSAYSMLMMFMMGVAMLVGTNYLAIIAISREGSQFYMVKYMPIRIDEYIHAKQYLASIYIVIGTIFVGLVASFSKIGYVAKIGLIANILLFGLAMVDFSIYKDLKKPMLDWINIKQALKSRFTVMIPMLIGMLEGIVLGVMYGIVSSVWKNVQGAQLVCWGVLSVVNIVLLIVFKMTLKENQYKLFNNIEANNG